jgi:DNA-binding transcriptional LysR family regulator
MREMAEAVTQASAAAGHTKGVLRINTLGMAASEVIAPRLGRFIAPTRTLYWTSLSTTR